MSRTFFTSDLYFYHKNILKFQPLWDSDEIHAILSNRQI